MNKQDDKKMIEPQIKEQSNLIEILGLCSDLRDENKKNNWDGVKNQIKTFLCITDDERYNYYIENNHLRIDRLIIDGKIAKAAITNIDELMEHLSTARLDIQVGDNEYIFYTKNCLEDLIRYVLYKGDGYINGVRFRYEEIKKFKSVFSDDALKNTKYIFYLPSQTDNLKNINYDNLEDLQKHICYKSICSHSDFKNFIRSKMNDSSVKLKWQTNDFDFLSRLIPSNGAVNNFDILCEIVNFDDNSVTYTKLIDSYFNIKSVKNITPFIKIISNKKEFWNIVDKKIFSDTAFHGYDIFNAQDRKKLGIEFKPTELYIVATVLSFVFGVVPFLFLGDYFIRKARESYTFNNKFRWINEKRKTPKNKNNPKCNIKQVKNKNLNQGSSISDMIPDGNLNDKNNNFETLPK